MKTSIYDDRKYSFEAVERSNQIVIIFALALSPSRRPTSLCPLFWTVVPVSDRNSVENNTLNLFV